MTKKQKAILVWILVWAGLLIVVLYSPIGSPHFYSSTGNYYVAYQPVTAISRSIANAPKTNSAVESNSDELIIPDVSLTSRTNAGGGSYQSGNASSGGSSYGSMQTQSYQSTNAGSGSASGVGSFIASGGSRSSAGTSGIVMTNGIATMSTTSNVNTATNRQGISAADPPVPSSGGTDPGGDPTGPAIPIGDGWGLLVLFGVCYVAFKKREVIGREIKKEIVHRLP